jgi:hypothetical protein
MCSLQPPAVSLIAPIHPPYTRNTFAPNKFFVTLLNKIVTLKMEAVLSSESYRSELLLHGVSTVVLFSDTSTNFCYIKRKR